MLESFAGWLTPTSLFLLLNIVIGTIWLTSLFGSHHRTGRYNSPPPLAGAPSLIDRVKSINFGLHNHSDGNDQYFPPAEHVYARITAQHAPLTRAPSIMDRVKSVNFNDFQFSFFGSEFHNSEPEFSYPVEPNPVENYEPGGPDLRRQQLARAPSLLERVKSRAFADLQNFSVFRSEPTVLEPEISVADRYGGEIRHVRRRNSENKMRNPGEQNEPAGPDLRRRSPLARAPSLLERMKSIAFTVPEPEISVTDLHVGEDRHVWRSKSENKTAAKAEEKMRKSASENRGFRERPEEVERRRPETARVERTVSIGGDVSVDAKADDFINKFKQQLKLQRLDSILQYKEMITRGASK